MFDHFGEISAKEMDFGLRLKKIAAGESTMADRDEVKVPKPNLGLITALFLAALVIIMLAWPAALEQRQVRVEAERRTEQRLEAARLDIATKCGSLAGQQRSDCSQPIDDAAREIERQEYELAAQRAVSIWTSLMGVVAVFGLALSGVGAYLVWTTFAETRRANAIAQDSAMRQLRAYIAIEGLDGPRLALNFNGNYVVTLRLVNSGPTPAVRWMYHYCWRIAPPDVGKDFFTDSFEELGITLGTLDQGEFQYAFGPAQAKTIEITMELSSVQVATILHRLMRLYVMISIEYIDVYGYLRSTQCFHAYNVDIEPTFGQMRWHNRMT